MHLIPQSCSHWHILVSVFPLVGLSADGYLMPTKKGQAPPDLRYFNQSRK
jgi:hypothetical protein